ncbi:Tetraspanin-3, partial [Trichinella pseudospiralis]
LFVTMGFGRCSSKMVLGLVGLSLWVAAISLFFISGYALVTYKHYDSFTTAQYALAPAIFLSFIGIVFFLTGLLGCCSVCSDSKCLVFSFFTSLALLMIMLITAVSLTVTYRSDIDAMIVNTTQEALKRYGEEKAAETSQIDLLQSQMQCCGFNNYTDWRKTPWGEKPENEDRVPKSCCKPEANDCVGNIKSQLNLINEQGCYAIWQEMLKSNIKRIAVGGVVFLLALVIFFYFIFVNILGMICSCVLLCYKSKAAMYTSLR